MPSNSKGGDVSTHWQRGFSAGNFDARAYYGWTDRVPPGSCSKSSSGLDLQFSANRIGRHLLTGGLGLRYLTEQQHDAGEVMNFSESESTQRLWSIYAQDEIYLFSDKVRVTAGAKLDDFTFTGLAFQPTLRTLWHVNESQALWAAASRAVRSPSHVELYSHMRVLLPGDMEDMPIPSVLLGDDDLQPETVDAHELGWRWRLNPRLTLDSAVYYNQYRDLTAVMHAPPVIDGLPPLPNQNNIFVYANSFDTSVYGAEVSVEWAATDRLRGQVNGKWNHMREQPPSSDLTVKMASDPRHWFGSRMRIDLSHAVELDVSWRYVGALSNYAISGYSTLDLRTGWHPADNVELSLTLNNALDDKHIEFFDETANTLGASIGRAVFGRVVWYLGR